MVQEGREPSTQGLKIKDCSTETQQHVDMLHRESQHGLPSGTYQPTPSGTYRPSFLVPRSNNEAPAALQPTEAVAPPIPTEPAEPQHGDTAPVDTAPGDVTPGDVTPVAPAIDLPKEPGL